MLQTNYQPETHSNKALPTSSERSVFILASLAIETGQNKPYFLNIATARAVRTDVEASALAEATPTNHCAVSFPKLTPDP